MKNIKTILCGGLVAMLVSCSPQVTTTNYYFDSVNGDDANNGTSVRTPFKSLTKLQSLTLKGGDSILLKSGAVFTEKLLLSCCGEENNPVVLGKYGGLEKPHIKGNGVDTAAVHILNSENLVIRDLEISNKGDAPKAGLLGLWVELDKFGESHNMVIDDLYVHDVYGSTVIEKGGGIGICIQNGRDNDSILNRFVGMTIENCYLKDCQRDGIKFKGYWIRKQWNPNLGVVIRKNVLDGVPGAGGVLDKEFVVQWTGHGSVVVRTAGVWSQGVRHIADCDGEGILLFAAGRCSSFGVFFLLLFCFFFGCLGGRLRICILCRCIAGAASCNRQRHGCCQQQCQNSFLHRCFPPFSTSPTDSSWNQPCCNLFALCRCFINYYTRTIGFAQFLNSV